MRSAIRVDPDVLEDVAGKYSAVPPLV